MTENNENSIIDNNPTMKNNTINIIFKNIALEFLLSVCSRIINFLESETIFCFSIFSLGCCRSDLGTLCKYSCN